MAAEEERERRWAEAVATVLWPARAEEMHQRETHTDLILSLPTIDRFLLSPTSCHHDQRS